MVQVNYLGRLGNNLFQYALGRIIAENMGYSLNAAPIPGFPITYEPVVGKKQDGYFLKFEGQLIDLDNVYRQRMAVNLSGWFQNYRYYKPYKEKIRLWFYTCPIPEIVGESDVVLHLRRTQGPIDYQVSYEIGDKQVMMSPDLLSFEYYDDILKSLKFETLHICTDMINDPFIRHFDKYKPKIYSGDMVRDFCILRKARRLIMSISTYSWWAAFLSDAMEIWFPKPEYASWSKPDCDLFVYDEPRFKLMPAKRIGTFV